VVSILGSGHGPETKNFQSVSGTTVSPANYTHKLSRGNFKYFPKNFQPILNSNESSPASQSQMDNIQGDHDFTENSATATVTDSLSNNTSSLKPSPSLAIIDNNLVDNDLPSSPNNRTRVNRGQKIPVRRSSQGPRLPGPSSSTIMASATMNLNMSSAQVNKDSEK